MLPWRRSDLYGPIFARASVASSIIVTVSALRFFFTVTLKRPWIVEDDIPAGRQAKKLPVVLSQEEVARFLGAVDNLKHRVILTVCYATGLRMTFTVWGDPATRYERMQVRVVGKGLPQVCSTPRKPISAPRCSGSAAMVRKVSDATRNRMSYTTVWRTGIKPLDPDYDDRLEALVGAASRPKPHTPSRAQLPRMPLGHAGKRSAGIQCP